MVQKLFERLAWIVKKKKTAVAYQISVEDPSGENHMALLQRDSIVSECMVCVQQGQGGSSSAIQPAVEPEPEPRQARSRWTDQLDPLTILTKFSPSPTKSHEQGQEVHQNDDEEEEEDFHPQSLDSLLGEEEEEVIRL